MDSLPLNVCKVHEKNEVKIEEAYKVVCLKRMRVQEESKTLRIEVKQLEHETALLDKEKYCLESKNNVLEEEMLKIKEQTEEATKLSEDIKWKMFKIGLLKEYEQKHNENVHKIFFEEKRTKETILEDPMDTSQILDVENTQAGTSGTKMKIAQLKDEIEIQKRDIKVTDPNLLINMKMLEKRNAALLTRYQRQIGEATSRYRQTVMEVKSLKKILEEVNTSLNNPDPTVGNK